ncbi:hypothetical protein SAMN05216249_104156 [Acetitomaculum ruminis DSM 5522]|uniref:Lipoprotein n=1 Tax=Acetitomaculum ruminis DSM 5522 TaxID=1120918 RepID=A0A1I0WMX7_9FIRM|nr:hypothetical protein [Acetitomaculum ruminis]SFA89747.1 hypothetical protein SAMN05216249_104156 [Acetitomaculum ruminis DSM 5522]
MIKKIIILLTVVILVCVGCSGNSDSKSSDNKNAKTTKEEAFDLENLKLTQSNTYMAISKNEKKGYNRWIFFFFSYESKEDLDEKDVEESLYNSIKSISMKSDSKELYVEKEPIISVGKNDKNKYDINIELQPDVGALNLDGPTNISDITIKTSDSQKEYSFDNYILEEKETFTEDEFSVTSSAFFSQVSEDSTASATYALENNGKAIQEISLEYSDKMDFIKNTKVDKTNPLTEDESKTSVFEALFELKEDFEYKTFRPFIKIKTTEKEGYVVPSVPLWFVDFLNK